MRLTPNQVVTAVAQPGDNPTSILHGIYSRRWNGILEGMIEKGAAIQLTLDNACPFVVLLELNRALNLSGQRFQSCCDSCAEILVRFPAADWQLFESDRLGSGPYPRRWRRGTWYV